MVFAEPGDADVPQFTVVATAVSRHRTVLAEVSADGYVVGVRLLNDAPRQWDSEQLDERITAVAAVAHDRYLANIDTGDGRYPSLESVAAAESDLDF